MGYREDLYRRMTSGQSKSEARYLDKITNRGESTPSERDIIQKMPMPPVKNIDPNKIIDRMPNVNSGVPVNPQDAIQLMNNRGTITPNEREYLSQLVQGKEIGRAAAEMDFMSPAELSRLRTMGQEITPAEKEAFVKSMEADGFNLHPGQGFVNAMDKVFKAPGILSENQAANIASGSSNVSPYAGGLSSQMYYNPLKGLLGF